MYTRLKLIKEKMEGQELGTARVQAIQVLLQIGQ